MQPSEVLTRTELGLTQSVDQLTWSNNRKCQTVALNILNKVHILHFQLIQKKFHPYSTIKRNYVHRDVHNQATNSIQVEFNTIN